MEVGYFITTCGREYWMRVPLMGFIFASMYQVAVVVLSWFGPCTCLPLYAIPGKEPPTIEIAMALVGQHHFVPILLLHDYCPIPPPPRQWYTYKYVSVDGWDSHPRFSSRFTEFLTLRDAAACHL